MIRWIDELNVPLSNLMGSLELIQNQIDEKSYDRIWRCCRELQEIKSLMRRLAVIYSEKTVVRWERVLLRDVLNQAVQAALPMAQNQKILLQTMVEACDRWIWSDGHLLSEALEYLLRYLIRCSEEKSVILLGCTICRQSVRIWAKNSTAPGDTFWNEQESGQYLELCRSLAAPLGAVVNQRGESMCWEIVFPLA